MRLPRPLQEALWAHARREAPRECVGVLAGRGGAPQALCPLPNVSPSPQREYLADPGALLRALKGMECEGLTLCAIYHSHPHGPAQPSRSDVQLAAYGVPYLIADLTSGQLRAFLLPELTELPLELE